MTNEEIIERLEGAGFPEAKAGLAATRLVERLANLCLVAGILDADPKHNEERKRLFGVAWQEIVEAGPDDLQLKPIEEHLRAKLEQKVD